MCVFFSFSYSSSLVSDDSSYLSDQNELKKLKELIQQRDNEISILYNYIEERYCTSLLKYVAISCTS